MRYLFGIAGLALILSIVGCLNNFPFLRSSDRCISGARANFCLQSRRTLRRLPCCERMRITSSGRPI